MVFLSTVVHFTFASLWELGLHLGGLPEDLTHGADGFLLLALPISSF